jgi:hypothetical protein
MDNGMDFRVCTAGIQPILGFARLELASVPEKISVTNFCFCDDGLASFGYAALMWQKKHWCDKEKLRLENPSRSSTKTQPK